MIADAIIHEAAVAVGLGVAQFVWRLGWPLIRSWARDFALQDS